MNRGLAVAGIAMLLLAFGCDGDSGNPADNAGVPHDTATGCGGATATVFAGSCTYTVSGLTTCAEDYYGHALSDTELQVYTQACSGSGFTFSADTYCSTTDIACTCIDTTGLFKRVKYGYGVYAEACGTCAGDCYSRQ